MIQGVLLTNFYNGSIIYLQNFTLWGTKMKNKILKITSAICIIISLVLLFCPTLVRFGSTKGSEMREFRNGILSDLETVKENVVFMYETNNVFVEDMKDNNLPKTKGEAKQKFRETKELMQTLLDGKISVIDVVNFSTKTPGVIKDAENLLESNYGNWFFELSKFTTYEETSDIVDSTKGIAGLSIVPVVFFVLLALLGLAAAILPIFNKGNVLRWIYFIVLTLFVAAIFVGVNILSTKLSDALTLEGKTIDMFVKTTIFPFLSVVFAVLSLAVGIIFKKFTI